MVNVKRPHRYKGYFEMVSKGINEVEEKKYPLVRRRDNVESSKIVYNETW